MASISWLSQAKRLWRLKGGKAMSKSLSYLFHKTIGHIRHTLRTVKFSTRDLLEQLKSKNKSFDSFPKTIAEGSQGKHIVGHNNYLVGRSILSISMKEAQQLINIYAGRGRYINANKEKVDFGRQIGFYVNENTAIPTSIGIIHYSKNVHISYRHNLKSKEIYYGERRF